MKTYITEATYNPYDEFGNLSSCVILKLDLCDIDVSTLRRLFVNDIRQCETELLFGDELKEYKKFKENKEKIKNILGEDFNMEFDFRPLVEAVVDEKLGKTVELKTEVEKLRCTVEELEAENSKLTSDNTELSVGFKQLLADQQEALDYIDELEAKLSRQEAVDVEEDETDCSCCECEHYCGQIDELPCAGIAPCCMDNAMSLAPAIKNIYYCDEPGKEKTIVIFTDGSKVIKTLVEGDKFDLNVGVALCVAERMYGGKTKYHKMIKKIAGVKEKKNVETTAEDVKVDTKKKVSNKK